MRKSKLVLVVEDDDDSRQELSELLSDEGYRVLALADGREALNVLAQLQPDLILLDLMMPIVSGWEVLAVLEADSKLSSIPVVVLSAYAAQAPRGVACALNKPLSIANLLTAVRSACK